MTFGRKARAAAAAERALRPGSSWPAIAVRLAARRAYWKTKLALRHSPSFQRVDLRARSLLVRLLRLARPYSGRHRSRLGRAALANLERCILQLHRRGRWDESHQTYRRLIELQETLAREAGLDPFARRYAGRDFLRNVGTLAMLDVIAKQEIAAGDASRNVILARPEWISNACYLDHYRAYFTVVDDPEEVASVELEAELLRMHAHTWRDPDGRAEYVLQASAEMEELWETEGREPLLRLSDAELEAGRASLAALGVPRDRWFVALHVREGMRYDSVRDAQVATYGRAVAAVVERDGYVVAMGDRVPSPFAGMPGVVDYAAGGARSAEMDVFLWAACRFMIGTNSGPSAAAGTFGVPVVTTNWLLPHRNWFRNHVSIVKLYRSEREQRLLTFAEALSSPVAFLPDRVELASHGITVVDNTADEIEEAVVEMLDRLEGRAVYTEEDEDLQRRFHASVPSLEYPIPAGGARIGRDFLRRYRDLCSEP